MSPAPEDVGRRARDEQGWERGMGKSWKAVLGGMALACCMAGLHAEPGPVVLTVSGKISQFTNKEKNVYEFREQDLQNLKQHSVVTKTSWTPQSVFSGPLMRDILAKVGASGQKVKLRALNDYVYWIDRREFYDFDVVLARSVNNKLLDITNRGPLWLMYPLDQMPEDKKGPVMDAKLVWQINRLVVF